MELLSLFLMLLLAVSSALSARIAGFCAVGGSQYINTRHTLEELANRGHEVCNSRALKKTWTLDRQLSLNVAYPGQVFLLLYFFILSLPWALTHPASRNENLLARRANLLVPNNRSDGTFYEPWINIFALSCMLAFCILGDSWDSPKDDWSLNSVLRRLFLNYPSSRL